MMPTQKIYNVHKSVISSRKWWGFTPLIIFYIFYCFIVPVLEGFKKGGQYGVERFLFNQKDFFSYNILTDHYGTALFAFCITYQLILYFGSQKELKLIKIDDKKLKITLFNKSVINALYSDVIKIASDHPEEEINLHLEDGNAVKITNDIVNYAELRDFIFKEVNKRGGEVLVRDESKKD